MERRNSALEEHEEYLLERQMHFRPKNEILKGLPIKPTNPHTVELFINLVNLIENRTQNGRTIIANFAAAAAEFAHDHQNDLGYQEAKRIADKSFVPVIKRLIPDETLANSIHKQWKRQLRRSKEINS